MPELPTLIADDEALELPAVPTETAEPSPYLRIAADLRAAIRCGALDVGDALPTIKDLATRFGVSVATAHRATWELAAAGQAEASRGKRAVVCRSF